jgi:hypothetical protein
VAPDRGARRPHDALRDPYFPRRVLPPNDKYAALVAAAGYLPVMLTGEDYLKLPLQASSSLARFTASRMICAVS